MRNAGHLYSAAAQLLAVLRSLALVLLEPVLLGLPVAVPQILTNPNLHPKRASP
jgi:hypothetical protein